MFCLAVNLRRTHNEEKKKKKKETKGRVYVRQIKNKKKSSYGHTVNTAH